MKTSHRSRIVFLALSALLVVPLLGTGLGAASAQGQGDSDDSLYKYLSVFTETLRLVRSVYVEETDLRNLMAGALDGATDALDPFSVYVPADQADAYRRARELSFRQTGLQVLKDRGVAYVVAVEEGSPADQAGLQAGDILSEIQGLSSRAMPLWQVRGFLAAESGSTVRMEVLRQGSSEEIELELGTYEPPPVRSAERRGFAVVRVPRITTEAGAQLDRELAAAADRPVLLDLRGVAGGDGEAAYELASRFVGGELGFLLEDGETVEQYENSAAPSWAGDVSVLVDRGTQGAAEVLAAVLHHHGARLVGTGTFGHAGKTNLVRLASGAYLELTEAFFAGPDREPLDESLEPDLAVRILPGEDETDAVLEEALDLLIEPESEAAEDVA